MTSNTRMHKISWSCKEYYYNMNDGQVWHCNHVIQVTFFKSVFLYFQNASLQSVIQYDRILMYCIALWPPIDKWQFHDKKAQLTTLFVLSSVLWTQENSVLSLFFPHLAIGHYFYYRTESCHRGWINFNTFINRK